jgi:uncharacterized protein (DUF2126 family)/transglutaminase-like putative cysteine protease
VKLSPHVIRLRPAPHTRTPVHHYSLKVSPSEQFLNWQQDPFGNYIARLVFPKRSRKLVIEVSLVADLVTIDPFDFFLEEYAQKFPFEYAHQLRSELLPYLETIEAGPLLKKWLSGVPMEEHPTVDFLVWLNQKLEQDIDYNIRMEPGVQDCEETLETARGSCRDSAWLMVQILRHLGLAARFVSGYLVQLAPDMESLDGPSGPKQDFTDLHAWAEVFIPGAGWVGLDPTSGLFAGEGHIPLACTPDPVSASPVEGATDKCEVSFSYINEVTRIHEDPRVTRPFSDDAWTSVMQLGQYVDEKLMENDTRLTMGGEPTFVSIDDMDGAEWNTDALGPHKRERAEVLFRRLWKRFAPGGVLHHGQGKWYPGEMLPRWALSCLWRDDSVPLWREEQLLADPMQPGQADDRSGHVFITLLANQLGIDDENVLPGYEDVLYYLWKEGSLPKNVDVMDNKLEDPLERQRLRKIFEQGLNKVVGYTIPLAWDTLAKRWVSSTWKFRREHMYLIPGDSPMGYRLPLDSLLWQKKSEKQKIFESDPFADKAELPNYVGGRYTRLTSTDSSEHDSYPPQAAADDYKPEELDDENLFVRTALCVEVRDGHLHIFLPPVNQLDHWVDLLAHIETCAEQLKQPVILEGYPAPHDHRLKRFSVTPDPGVIEVNIHPSDNWQELVDNTEILYEEARQARLGTEKFMLDGRHTGTGGGNHVTLGGPSPADSPMLRKPQVLASLIRYWQNHPSLSYLFSGMFVGPTSQAPRVDEGRDDYLYELEIALRQLPANDSNSPWLIDRILRNHLVDLTGNTHRSEFCIDKLYSPDSASGRLGIVEFRGFEMPPHPRMATVQNLLLRSLVSRFWEVPYEQQLVHWGTELHDRFMLPHYIGRDIQDVVGDLQKWGYAFDAQWLDAFHEFRFPHYGRINIDDIEIDLQFAIEPWDVLGEEATAQGTARYVDSSVERLQVKVNGMTNPRHLVTCNGRRLPLRNTGKRGEYVAGVRYKAWAPHSALHPTIPVHAPLVFDLIDLWNRRSIGGCTYHVEHPGGRNTDELPINANAAESRRLARFWQHGHSQGEVMIPNEEPSGDFPYTLDLRY